LLLLLQHYQPCGVGTPEMSYIWNSFGECCQGGRLLWTTREREREREKGEAVGLPWQEPWRHFAHEALSHFPKVAPLALIQLCYAIMGFWPLEDTKVF
jgi:hypothetical protein